MWIAASLEGIWQDVVAGVRNLCRHPSFTITAVLTASLGIGAATAVFSVVDRVLFRTLPYADEDRLVSVGMMTPMDSNEFMFPDGYFHLRSNPGPFEAMASFQAGALACDLTEHNPLRLQCLRVEANFFDTLGVPLQLGRSFTSEEDRPNGSRVAIISHGVWQSRFAGDPGVLGRTIDLDGGSLVTKPARCR